MLPHQGSINDDEDLEFYNGDDSGSHAPSQFTGHFPEYNTGYANTMDYGRYDNDDALLDDKPFLEEMGIDLEHIATKTRAVLFPVRLSRDVIDDADLGGPLLYLLFLGVGLMLSGKAHFGYIYGFGVVGCLGMYIVLNLMSSVDLSLERIVSILGYSLLPIVLLSLLSIGVSLQEGFGFYFSIVCILWCTFTATAFMESAFKMHAQRYLLAYPVALLYTCFALITIF